jgi:glycosyltransferase involved in cell wall biosynthesis
MSGGLRVWMPTRVALAHGVGGGMERHADALARGLAASGHEITVVTTAHPEGIAEERADGVRTLYVPDSTWRRYGRGWWEASWMLLSRAHAREPYDVILGVSAGGLGYAQLARRQLGLPSVAILYGSARSELLASWRGARNARGAYRLVRALWRAPLMLARWRRARGSVASWLAVSGQVAEAARGEIGIPAARMAVVPSGVDVERFRPDPEARARLDRRLSLPPDAPVLVTASRLEFEKGVHVALEAMARLRSRHPQARLLIAGRGRYEHALRARAAALGLDGAVRFLGLLGGPAVAELLAGADVCVVPSLCPEGSPLAAIEAQACAVPVVGSDVDGLTEAVEDGGTGQLVPRGSAEGLADALDALLRDTRRRRELGSAGRERALRRFSEDAMVRSTERALRDVVDAG